MKSDSKLVAALNSLLADELTAINQYMVHSEMCDNWGYGKLHKGTFSFLSPSLSIGRANPCPSCG